MITRNKLVIAGKNLLDMATFAKMKEWLRDIFGGNLNFFTLVDFCNTASTNRIRNSTFYLIFIATQEALAVDHALLVGIGSAINNLRHDLVTPRISIRSIVAAHFPMSVIPSVARDLLNETSMYMKGDLSSLAPRGDGRLVNPLRLFY